MNLQEFSFELDGQRVVVNPATQEVCVLDAEGRALLQERIQVAAGSVQGLFTQATGMVNFLERADNA